MANKDKVTSPKVARNASSLLREEVSLKAPKWTFEEYVLALNLYLESDRGAVGKTSPKVQILSQQMRALRPDIANNNPQFRSPSSGYLRLMNFRHLDSMNTGIGMSHVLQGCREIWEKFGNDRDRVAHLAAQILMT